MQPCDAEPSSQPVHREGEERLEQNCQVGCDLQGDIHDSLHPFGICLDHLPRFGVSKVLVPEARKVHRLGKRLAEPEGLKVALRVLTAGHDRLHRLFVIIIHDARDGNSALVVVCRQYQCAVDEVAEDGN